MDNSVPVKLKKVSKEVTEKYLLVMKKGDVGMVKHFSKKYGNKG